MLHGQQPTGAFNEATGEIRMSEVQRQPWTPIYAPRMPADHSDLWRFATIVVAVITVVGGIGWIFHSSMMDRNQAFCLGFCQDLTMYDRYEVSLQAHDRHGETMARIAADERIAVERAHQEAALEKARIERESLVFEPHSPATRIVGGGGVVAEHGRGGVATLDGPGRCIMHGGHEGEKGYLWRDGRCHHLPPDTTEASY